MSTPLERAEEAVEAAALDIASAVDAGRGLHAAIRAFERAVEARHEARLREAANSPHLDDRTRAVGHYFADVITGWPTGSRIKFGPGEGLEPPITSKETRP